MRLLLLLIIGTALSAAGEVERRLYVTDRTGISVYNIDQGHKLLKRIDIPNSGNYKGISASISLARLYVTSNTKDELICLDLKTDQILWRKQVGDYVDSMDITPDGRRLYLPVRGEDSWKVIDASDGAILATIPVGRGKNYEDSPIGSIGPHNTWMHPAGKRVYFEVLTLPYVYQADTRTNRIISQVGPFSKGIRPFAVSDDERFVYANVDALLGFEIGDIRTGKVIQKVIAETPPSRLKQVPNPPAHKPHSTPSHGINLSPDQKEVWMVDGVYGYVYAYNVQQLPPKLVASIPLFAKPEEQPHPGWISFSIDGRYAYPDGPAVIDARTKKVAARISLSEKLIEIDFAGGVPVKASRR